MKISKKMMLSLRNVAKGKSQLEEIALLSGLSASRCSQVLTELEEAHLIRKKRVGNKVIFSISDSSIAESFKKMIAEKPHIRYESFLYGTNLEVLKAVIREPKSVKVISEMFHCSPQIARLHLRSLRKFNLIWKKRAKYSFAGEAYPEMKEFILRLRQFSEKQDILWKFWDEEIFRQREPYENAELSGLNRYEEYGISVNTVDFLYISPKRKLEKNEVFTHSLLQIKDEPRILAIAISFYFKNNIKEKNILPLLEKYDLAGLFAEFKKTIIEFAKDRTSMIKNNILPSISGGQIQRILETYGVKHV